MNALSSGQGILHYKSMKDLERSYAVYARNLGPPECQTIDWVIDCCFSVRQHKGSYVAPKQR